MTSMMDGDLLQTARRLGMEVLLNLPKATLSRDLTERIPYPFVKRHLLLPLSENEKGVTVVIGDPLNLQALDELHLMLDKPIHAVYTPKETILAAIPSYYHQEEGETSKFIAHLGQENGTMAPSKEVDAYDLLDLKQEAPIVKLLNLILSEAIGLGASDIHFEPFEGDLKIRYRIDGVLQTRHTPKRELQAELLTRIKVLGKLDIAEQRLPQDGRIKLRMGGREIDFRVSTVPVPHGERIVLRILDKENVQFGLEQLGMLPSTLQQFKRLISLSEGIVLVTGPTGSGKTTTLYSALAEIMSEELNIMTIEDPIEYKREGVGQIAVHPKIGLTFAEGLKHILRQDPDVILVGEIRDGETAEIAIQAALTGHLVLSTLHTNDAPSAITRLVDMGIERYLLSSTVVGILAQRLVRRICSHCRVGYTPSDEQLQELGIQRKELVGGQLFYGKGCNLCFGSGYKGRHGIYELLTVTPALQSAIAKNPDATVLRALAKEGGMQPLLTNALHLVIGGITSSAEARIARAL